MEILIAPHFLLDTISKTVWRRESACWQEESANVLDLDLGTRIIEDRMTGWFIEPARRLLRDDNAVAAVQLVTPLVEALEELHRGESSQHQSETFFRRRAAILFSCDEDSTKMLYSGVRNGFAHSGFLHHGWKVLIAPCLGTAIERDGEVFRIGAEQYVNDIAAGYQGYYSAVRSDPTLKERFSKVWYPGLMRKMDMFASGTPTINMHRSNPPMRPTGSAGG